MQNLEYKGFDKYLSEDGIDIFKQLTQKKVPVRDALSIAIEYDKSQNIKHLRFSLNNIQRELERL
jgi:hypothetical protein